MKDDKDNEQPSDEMDGEPEEKNHEFIDVEQSTCPGFVFASSYISQAAIYADDERVYGMRLLSISGPADFGSLTKGDPPVLESFLPTEQFIGFYGSFNGEYITSLGFLTNDPTCIPIPDPEPEPEVVEVVEVVLENVDTDDGSLGAGGIVGIILAILVVIALGVVGFLLWRRRKRQRLT